MLIDEAQSLLVLICSVSIKISFYTKTPWGGDLCRRLHLTLRSLWLCIEVLDLNVLLSYFLLEDILRLLDIDSQWGCFGFVILLGCCSGEGEGELLLQPTLFHL